MSLSQVMYKQKGLVLVIIFITTSLWGLFIFNLQPKYHASVVIGPLGEGRLAEFTKEGIKPNKLYRQFSIMLRSELARKLLYQKNRLPYGLSLIDKSTFKRERYFLDIKHNTPMQAVQSIEQFINIANTLANQKIAFIIAKQEIDKITQNQKLTHDLSIVQSGIKNVLLSTKIVSKHLSYIKSVPLYHYDVPISLFSTSIDSKLKATLVLGILGGLFLGFIVSIYRINYVKHRCAAIPL
jgi:hypothetical protein